MKDKEVVLMYEKNSFNGFGKNDGMEQNAEKWDLSPRSHLFLLLGHTGRKECTVNI